MNATKEWVEEEFEFIDFNDKRLNKRLIRVATAFADSPESPINQACEDWAATKAAYNFFHNPKIKVQKIWQAHYNCTLKRIQSYPVVLAIQDSTHDKLQGKGPTGTRKQNLSGYLVHHALAVSTEGEPLGELSNYTWARKEIKKNRTQTNAKLPTSKKESYKWIRALKQIHEYNIQNTQIIHICDAESDFLDFFECANELDQEFIIRAHFDRALLNDSNHLWNFVLQQPVLFTKEINVTKNKIKTKESPKRSIREKRETVVEVRKGTISFALKETEYKLNVVYVKEQANPLVKDPIEWMLLTTLPIESQKNVEQIIKFYKFRWTVEDYHRILKSGCRVEECRLETTPSIKRYIALFCIIGWRLFWLNRCWRQDPEMPCTVALSSVEWKALYWKRYGTMDFPEHPPTLRECVHWIARLGGFLDRKGDGEPGITTLWRGWMRLRDIVDSYDYFSSYYGATFYD
jgi:uncharacterized protein involved in tolerance to divalent cations